MAVNYHYVYAEIDPVDNMCVGVHTMTYEVNEEYWVRLDVEDPDYIFKYYINGNWYEDAAGTIPWASSMV